MNEEDYTDGFNAGAPEDAPDMDFGQGAGDPFGADGAADAADPFGGDGGGGPPPFEAPAPASASPEGGAVDAMETLRDRMAARIRVIAETVNSPQGASRPPLSRYSPPARPARQDAPARRHAIFDTEGGRSLRRDFGPRADGIVADAERAMDEAMGFSPPRLA